MKLGKLGVWFPMDPLTTEQLAELAQRVEALGYAALWYPESRGHESFSLGGYLLARTNTLVLATGIANIYARDAAAAKQGQHSLNKLYGGRFLLGLGVSHIPTVEGLRGHSYAKPVATMRAYLEGMDQSAGMAQQLDEAPPTVIAALGPKMTALGGKNAAGIHPYNVTPEHTAWAREIVGPQPWVCVEQKIMMTTDATQAMKVAREGMARYMALPNYRNNWLRQGFSEAELDNGGSDRFLDAMVAWGDAATIKTRIQAHFDAGASHVCIQPLNPDGSPLPDMKALEALAP
ncbi:MAG: TIGR03620 family F420-dependent LLM class oxidoreductase [bacterium]